MAQAFSLYTELTIRQNLALARAELFDVREGRNSGACRTKRPRASVSRKSSVTRFPDVPSIGDKRQRLQPAVALIHTSRKKFFFSAHPSTSPSSGVDPGARGTPFRGTTSSHLSRAATRSRSSSQRHFINRSGRAAIASRS
jgi:hypothetical protein